MTDRLVKVREQGKLILRGLKPRGRAAILSLDRDEALKVTIDWSDWLGSDTIASVQNEVTSVSLTGATNTTTQNSFTVSASYSGWIESRITTASGQRKEMLIIVEVNGFPVNDDYGIAWKVV